MIPRRAPAGATTARTRRRCTLAAPFVLLAHACTPAPRPPVHPVPASLDVRVTGGLRVLKTAGALQAVDVVKESILLEAGRTFDEILVGQGVRPDGEAYSVLYALNPLRDPRDLRPGDRVWAPALRLANGALCGERCSVEITRDAELKKDFVRAVDSLADVTRRLEQVPRERFEPQVRAPFLEAATEAELALRSLRRLVLGRKHALSQRFAQTLNAEAALLHEVVATSVTDEAPIDSSRLKLLQEIQKDLEARGNCCNEKMGSGSGMGGGAWRWIDDSDAPVTIRTLSEGRDVGELRVIAVPVALKGKKEYEQAFPQLSSPASAKLPPGNYLIWAVEPRSGARTTDELRLPVVKSDFPVVAELVVKAH